MRSEQCRKLCSDKRSRWRTDLKKYALAACRLSESTKPAQAKALIQYMHDGLRVTANFQKLLKDKVFHRDPTSSDTRWSVAYVRAMLLSFTILTITKIQDWVKGEIVREEEEAADEQE